MQGDLEAARVQAERKAAAHKTFTPQELADRFPLFAGLTLEQVTRLRSLRFEVTTLTDLRLGEAERDNSIIVEEIRRRRGP